MKKDTLYNNRKKNCFALIIVWCSMLMLAMFLSKICVSADESLPSRYGDNSKPVYDQGDNGCCWAFAGTSLFEYTVDHTENVTDTSFSVQHMLQKLSVYGNCGYNKTTKNDGGDPEMISAYFVSGYGPVNAKNYPWIDSSELIKNYAYGRAEYRATDIIDMPIGRKKLGDKFVLDDNTNNEIKKAVYNNGAVHISIYMKGPDVAIKNGYLGEDGISYYAYDMAYRHNHEVLIVGWNDNWSKTNFKNHPQSDGAWLVRNSWGPCNAAGGYYWVSYEEATITPNITICNYEKMRDTETVYNLDESGSSTNYKMRDTEGGFINVFDIKSFEEMTAVTFYEHSTTASCQIYYVPINGNGTPNVSKKRAISEEKKIEYSGYHTINLNNQIERKSGTKVGIMVYVKDPEGIQIGREASYESKTNATLNEGESFLCDSAGNTTDFITTSASGNFSIKLIADDTRPSIATCKVFDIPIQAYTESQVKPEITVIDGGKKLVEGTDYTLRYEDNINVGTAKVILTGMGNYRAEKILNFTISNDISDATIENVKDQVYTGFNTFPTPKVFFENTMLFPNIHYIVASTHPQYDRVGTYAMTFFGRGKYKGEQTVYFRIVHAHISNTIISDISAQSFTGSKITPKPTITYNGKTLQEGVDYFLAYSDNIEPGTARMIIVGKGNFQGAISKQFVIE